MNAANEDWGAAGALIFGIVAVAAPHLAPVVEAYLSPNDCGGFEIADDRQAAFTEAFARRLVGTMAGRSASEILHVARAFKVLADAGPEAMSIVIEAIVALVTPHSPALRAREAFAALPVAGRA